MLDIVIVSVDRTSVLALPRVEEFSVFSVDIYSTVPEVASVGFVPEELLLLVDTEGPAVVIPGEVGLSSLLELDRFSSGEVDGIPVLSCGEVEGSSLDAKSVGFSLAGSVGYSVDSDRGSVGYSLVFPVVTAGFSLVF